MPLHRKHHSADAEATMQKPARSKGENVMNFEVSVPAALLTGRGPSNDAEAHTEYGRKRSELRSWRFHMPLHRQHPYCVRVSARDEEPGMGRMSASGHNRAGLGKKESRTGISPAPLNEAILS